MAVTQQDIARACGVSHTTVSLVLSGKAPQMNISRRVIDDVCATAEKLGYTRNYHAATLATGRTRTIGLILQSRLNSLYWATITEGIEKAAQRHGYDVLMLTTGPDEPIAAKSLRLIKESRIDALLAVGGYRQYTIQGAVDRGFPVVAIETTPQGLCAEVTFDSRPGIEAAIHHLAGLGHRELAWIGVENPDGSPFLPLRQQCVRKTCRARGMSVRPIMLRKSPGPDDFAAALQFYHQQLSGSLVLQPGETAILCYNDTVAVAASYILHGRGIRMPEDISLVGFDDLHAVYCVPPLTTISHRLDAMGARAVDLLLEMIEGKPPAKDRAVIPAELVVRGSVAAARRR